MPIPIQDRLRSHWFALAPRARAMIICGVVAVAGLGTWALVHKGDPVERAVARGDLQAAKTELKQKQVADAGARSYDAGRIAEAQRSWRTATTNYMTALRQGDQRGLDRLIDMTHDSSSCPARSAAASALGQVRDDRAVRALQDLRHARFADERKGKKSRHSACNSAQAARKALKRTKRGKA